eukprot:XP_027303700.1 serine/threonine-protein phosphatase 4 catalytic subunit 1-like [Anas platyrhynchos]
MLSPVVTLCPPLTGVQPPLAKEAALGEAAGPHQLPDDVQLRHALRGHGGGDMGPHTHGVTPPQRGGPCPPAGVSPSESNPYIFNGDFVDRGSFSVEVILTLFGFKLLYPDHFHLLRGNHETDNMNQIYGFEGEVKAKYTAQMFALFSEVFEWLPLAQCINGKVLVGHPGGAGGAVPRWAGGIGRCGVFGGGGP